MAKVKTKGRATDIDVYVGTRLKHFRILRGFTQEELADEGGITFQQIQKYENGTNRIAASRLFSFAQILEIRTDAFFEGYGDNKKL
jgi:transcriptional regulator with XRE-family HTH domain